jgi:hypothetical protein
VIIGWNSGPNRVDLSGKRVPRWVGIRQHEGLERPAQETLTELMGNYGNAIGRTRGEQPVVDQFGPEGSLGFDVGSGEIAQRLVAGSPRSARRRRPGIAVEFDPLSGSECMSLGSRFLTDIQHLQIGGAGEMIDWHNVPNRLSIPESP